MTYSSTQFEQALYPRVCKLVLESFNMSLEDSQEVVDSKLNLLDCLVVSLGGNSQRLDTK